MYQSIAAFQVNTIYQKMNRQIHHKITPKRFLQIKKVQSLNTSIKTLHLLVLFNYKYLYISLMPRNWQNN